MKILVIGCSGYIGSHLIKKLREKSRNIEIDGIDTGWFWKDITGTVRSPEQYLNNFKPLDMRNVSGKDLENYDAIVQLGAVSNDPIGNKFSAATNKINKEATCKIYDIAAEVGVKSFIFASSCSVYGIDSGMPKNEQDELSPLTEYAKSKIECEKYFEQSPIQLKTTNLRFATACGYTSRTRLDLVLNEFVAMALTEKQITIKSDGTPWRPLIHVDDMCKAIEWAIFREKGGQICTVNVGTNINNVKIRDLAIQVSKAIAGCKVEFGGANKGQDKRSYQVSFDKYANLSGYNESNSVSINQAIEDLKVNLEGISNLEHKYKEGKLKRLTRLNEYLELGLLSTELEWII